MERLFKGRLCKRMRLERLFKSRVMLSWFVLERVMFAFGCFS